MLDPTSLAYLRYREREKEKGTISFVRSSMYSTPRANVRSFFTIAEAKV